jgi:toluene monooxygenase system protein E
MAQLRAVEPEFGSKSRSDWENGALWQPLRRAVERLLVTYDWGEAFAALNLALKPAFDELFMLRFGELARAVGDDLLSGLFFSLNEDCRWHRDWSYALVRFAVEERPENLSVFHGWLAKWDPIVAEALEAVAPLFEDAPVAMRFADVWSAVQVGLRGQRLAIGLTGNE